MRSTSISSTIPVRTSAVKLNGTTEKRTGIVHVRVPDFFTGEVIEGRAEKPLKKYDYTMLDENADPRKTLVINN